MANRNNNDIKIANLNGLMLYHDKKNSVYYDIFTRNGYILTNAEARKYLLYSARYTFAIMAGCIIFYITNDLKLSALLTLIATVIMELLFRFTFIYKLPVIENYKRPRKPGYIQQTAENDSYFKIILLIVCGILFALMIATNAKLSDYDLLTTILSYVVTYGSLFIAVLNIVALIKKISSKRR